MLDGEAVPDFARYRPGGGAGTGRFQAENPAGRSWDSDRAATIPARGKRDQPGRNGRSRTARGAARGTSQVPRIVGWAKGDWFGKWRQAKFGRVGFAEDDQTGGFPAFDEFAVEFGWDAFPETIAVARGNSGQSGK